MSKGPNLTVPKLFVVLAKLQKVVKCLEISQTLSLIAFQIIRGSLPHIKGGLKTEVGKSVNDEKVCCCFLSPA